MFRTREETLDERDVSHITNCIKYGKLRSMRIHECTARKDEWASLFMHTGTLHTIAILDECRVSDSDEPVFTAHRLPRMGLNLRELRLEDAPLCDEIIQQLVRVIPPSLQEIGLSDTGLSPWAVGVLCQGLARLPALRIVNLNHVNLQGSFGHLASLIASSPSIVDLEMNDTNVSGQDLMLLARAIRDNPRFESLDAGYNDGITDTDARAFIKEVGIHPSFYCLCLWDGGCSSEVTHEVDERLYALHSVDSKVLVALCSGVVIKRLSPSFTLTIDVIRKLKDYL